MEEKDNSREVSVTGPKFERGAHFVSSQRGEVVASGPSQSRGEKKKRFPPKRRTCPTFTAQRVNLPNCTGKKVLWSQTQGSLLKKLGDRSMSVRKTMGQVQGWERFNPY